jgi:hypothetical protein
MLEGLQIVRIYRVGHDYVFQLSNGMFAVFEQEQIEPILSDSGLYMPMETPRRAYLN